MGAQCWQESDTEEVTCCLCDIPGTVMYRGRRWRWSAARAAGWSSSRRGSRRRAATPLRRACLLRGRRRVRRPRPVQPGDGPAAQVDGRATGDHPGGGAAARRRCSRSAPATGCSCPPPGISDTRPGASNCPGPPLPTPATPAASTCTAGNWPALRTATWPTRCASGTPSSTCRTRWSFSRGAPTVGPGRDVRVVRAVHLVAAGPLARPPVVDAQARAAHLALHPGNAAGRGRAGRPDGSPGVPVAAAPGQPRPVGLAGRRGPGAARPRVRQARLSDLGYAPRRDDHRSEHPTEPGAFADCHRAGRSAGRAASRRGGHPRRSGRARRGDDPRLAVHRTPGLGPVGGGARVRGGAAVPVPGVRRVRALPDGAARHPRRRPDHRPGGPHLRGQGHARGGPAGVVASDVGTLADRAHRGRRPAHRGGVQRVAQGAGGAAGAHGVPAVRAVHPSRRRAGDRAVPVPGGRAADANGRPRSPTC